MKILISISRNPERGRQREERMEIIIFYIDLRTQLLHFSNIAKI